MPTISEQLADFTARLSLDEVPGAVALRAKHLLLDAIGCGFAARKEPFAARIAKVPAARSAWRIACRCATRQWSTAC